MRSLVNQYNLIAIIHMNFIIVKSSYIYSLPSYRDCENIDRSHAPRGNAVSTAPAMHDAKRHRRGSHGDRRNDIQIIYYSSPHHRLLHRAPLAMRLALVPPTQPVLVGFMGVAGRSS